MTFAPALRKLTFTTHVTSSVGWLGAVIAFLALAAIGPTSPDERTVRGAYLVMAPAAWFVLVPLAHASLFSGIALSLGTTWGLFQQYWIVAKLGITVFATAILLIYMGTLRQMAGVAAGPVVELGLVRNPSPLVHSILALILLVAATALGIYKPFGETPYGRRNRDQWRQVSFRSSAMSELAGLASKTTSTPRWMYFLAIVVIGIMLLFLLLHLSGRTFHR